MWPLTNKYRLGIYLTPSSLHCALLTYQRATKTISQNTLLCFATHDSTQLKQQLRHMQQQYAQHCRHCHGMIRSQSAHLQVMTIDKQLSTQDVQHYIHNNSQSVFNHPLTDLFFDYQPMADNNGQQQWLLVACKKIALHTPTTLLPLPLQSLQVDAISCSQLIQSDTATNLRCVLAYCDQQTVTCYVVQHNRMLNFCRKDLLHNPQQTVQAITHLATSQPTQNEPSQQSTPATTETTETTETTVYLTGTNNCFLTLLHNQLTQSTPFTTHKLVDHYTERLLLQPANPTADNPSTDLNCHLYATLAALYGDGCR